MQKPRVRVYTDYKSPYAFVANAELFALEENEGVELEWLPYTLRIAEFMGTVEERTPHFWRKVRYSYMDARRYANAQGLTIKGPRRIYDAFYSSAGMLFAQRHGFFRPYHETVFRRFWNHELELDMLSEIAAVIAELGGSVSAFEDYVKGGAREEHDRIVAEAEGQIVGAAAAAAPWPGSCGSQYPDDHECRAGISRDRRGPRPARSGADQPCP